MRILPTLCTVLSLCLIFTVFNLSVFLTPSNTILHTERRMITPFPPVVSLQNLFDKAYYTKLDNYIADRLLGKDFVFTQVSTVFSRWFYQFDTTNAVRGQDNWLFLGKKFDNIIDKHTKDLPIDMAQINALLTDLSALQQRASSIKAHFFTIVSPDKETIYPEFYPKFLQTSTRHRYSEKTMKILRDNGISVIDLAPTLLQEKEKQQIYYKIDTHWNIYGAQAGFNYIYACLQSTQLHKDIPPSNQYRLEKTPPYNDDIIGIGGFYGLRVSEDLTGNFIADQKVQWHYPDKTITDSPNRRVEAYKQNYKVHMHNEAAEQRLKILVFCDSFMTALAPFFNINYSDVIYISREIPLQNKLENISTFSPQIVLYQTVERVL